VSAMNVPQTQPSDEPEGHSLALALDRLRDAATRITTAAVASGDLRTGRPR